MNARNTSAARPQRDPDPLVFWLITTLWALFLLFVPGAPGGAIAL